MNVVRSDARRDLRIPISLVQLINRSAKDLLQVSDIKALRSLEKVDKDLLSLLMEMDSGQKEIIRFVRYGKILNLSVRASIFILEKDKYKIVSLHDIKTELEEQEVKSWQKLVRILTHEIMNWTIPITNMVGIARDFLVDNEGNPKEIPGLDKEGSGIGLSLSRQIMKLHRGRIYVETEAGAGTTFILEF